MKIGNLGELSVAKELAKQGYEIYAPMGDNATYDLLIAKDGIVSRVEVKSTSTIRGAGYVVQIKKVRANKNQNAITNFDNTHIDILAVYIVPEDRVILFDAKEVTVKSTLTVYGDWRDGRVVDCSGLENQRGEILREFESHSLRQLN